MKDNYSKAYKEIIEILKYVPKEEVKKIPREIITMFEEKMDKNYDFSIDTKKSFNEQILLEETEAILSNIFVEYLATPHQKEVIRAKQSEYRKGLEESITKYSGSDLFKNVLKEDEKIKRQRNNIIYTNEKKESLFSKIKKLLIKILKLKL